MQNLALPSALNIETVEAFLTELRDVPLGSDGVSLDAGKVEVMTTPGVQLLLALEKSLSQMGGKLVIANPSAALSQTFQALGLSEKLTEWSKTNG